MVSVYGSLNIAAFILKPEYWYRVEINKHTPYTTNGKVIKTIYNFLNESIVVTLRVLLQWR